MRETIIIEQIPGDQMTRLRQDAWICEMGELTTRITTTTSTTTTDALETHIDCFEEKKTNKRRSDKNNIDFVLIRFQN